MIRLVEPEGPETGVTGIGLAEAARSALAADAVVITNLALSRERRLHSADGLSETELEVAPAICAAAAGGVRSVSGFHRVLYREARLPGVGGAAICALQRDARGFRNQDLALVFAHHASVAGAARGQARDQARSIPRDGALYALGIWDLEVTGYEALSTAITDELGTATGARGAGVLVWDEEEQLLRPLPGAFGGDPEVLPPAHAARDWSSSAARVFATGEPYLTNRAASDPGVLPDYVEAFGLERLMSLPLDLGPRRIGVLQVANKPTNFTITDLLTAAALRRRFAAAVQAVRMGHVLLRRQRVEEILGTMAVAIASGRNLQEFLSTALQSLCDTLLASVVALVPRAGAPMILRRGAGGGELEAMTISRARETTSLSVYGVGPPWAGEPGWSVLHVPVILEDEQVATITALRRGGGFFDGDECVALTRLAHLVALAWATERYQRRLADSARVTERQRVADELHDQVAQLLFAARLSLDHALEIPALPTAAAVDVSRGRDLLLRADGATREVMQRLSQVEEDGLPDRLAALVGGIEEEFGRPVQLEVAHSAAEAARAAGRPAANLLARATREALVNAAKHAGPCQLAVRLTVTRRNRLLLTVTDDGVGRADRRREGYGTMALRRAVRLQGGVLRVDESATGGTKVAVSLPL